jgi:hypothetical protein
MRWFILPVALLCLICRPAAVLLRMAAAHRSTNHPEPKAAATLNKILARISKTLERASP